MGSVDRLQALSSTLVSVFSLVGCGLSLVP